MQAELFYENKSDGAIPLFLIAQSTWQDGADFLSAAERNCFFTARFFGKPGDYCLIHDAQGCIIKAYVGSGEGNQNSALANAASQLPPGTYHLQEKLEQNASLFWALDQYRFTHYKSCEVQPRKLVIEEARDLQHCLDMARAVFLVRDLINEPANVMHPEYMSQVMQNMAQTHQAVFEQWVGQELVDANFPAIHAVGRSSVYTPRLLSLTWGKESHPKVSLVGKGVCFDSGGLNIKPASAMRLMKKDMGGAAQALGLAQWIMDRKLPIRLEVLIPAVENVIGPCAFRPGDILTMRNGLTVEIDNTDAEGRLVLADALTKAIENKPDLMIDFATLTGAARTAVGTEISAFFTNREELAALVTEAAMCVADPVWQLPLHAAYADQLNSGVADLVNCSSSPYAGAITAALFLQRFVDPEIDWMHFDIMAWNVSNKPGKPEGGEAMGIRALAEYLLHTYGE